MKMVLAQGNPGTNYERTRHNAGFLAIDFYARGTGATFQSKPKFFADIAEIVEAGEKILLVKPTTFYNETGKTARAIADFYKIDTADILVIHDELALPFGTIRTREKGSDAGNNGIKSLNAHLGEQYARIRIGIRSAMTDRIGAHDFVLSRFNASELAMLEDRILPTVSELIGSFARGTFAVTSHALSTNE